MHEVMKKTYELIDELDNSDLIKNISICKEKIENNSKIQELLKECRDTDDKYIILDIKNKLYKYEEYKEYMKEYNEIMFLVMNINSRYKKIIKNNSCFK